MNQLQMQVMNMQEKLVGIFSCKRGGWNHRHDTTRTDVYSWRSAAQLNHHAIFGSQQNIFLLIGNSQQNIKKNISKKWMRWDQSIPYSYLVETSVYSSPHHLSPNVACNQCISCYHLEHRHWFQGMEKFVCFWQKLQEKHERHTPSNVAIFGWIIPEPFAIPPTLTVLPPTWRIYQLL